MLFNLDDWMTAFAKLTVKASTRIDDTSVQMKKINVQSAPGPSVFVVPFASYRVIRAINTMPPSNYSLQLFHRPMGIVRGGNSSGGMVTAQDV